MADVAISRPAANEKQTIQSQPDARYVFDFQSQDATLARDGNNLVINFDDGSGVNIENFYETHSQESMPSFQINGEEVSGQAFFEALNEPDLMPAAGPAASTATATAQRGGRYNDYGNSELGGGLDHLTRLDYQSDRGFEWEDHNWITSPDGDWYANNPLSSVPVTSIEPHPPLDTPDLPPVQTPERPSNTPPQTPSYTPPLTPVTPPQDYTPPEPPRDVPPVTPPPGYTPPTGVTPPPGGSTPPPDEPTIDNPPHDPDTPPPGTTPPDGGTPPPTGETPPDGETPPPGTTPPDPDQPGGDNFIPATGASHVVVDEGALLDGSGTHKFHGEGGEYHFQSYIPPEEGGTIVLSGVDGNGSPITMTFTVNVDGSFAADPVIRDASGAVMESGAFMSANGVELSNFTLSGGENGNWQVNYDYSLTQNQYHDKQGNAADSDYSTDTVNFDQGAVAITVTDGSGDTVNSQINVEVHDDVPVLAVTETGGGEETSFTGKFTTTFGADHQNGIPFTIDGNEAKESGEGSWTFEVDGGKLIVTSEGGTDYSYQFVPDEGKTFTEKTFEITAIDGDKDTSTGVIKVINNAPTITPDPDPEPGPGPDPEPGPDPNPDPNDPDPDPVSVDIDGMHIRVDEASLAATKDENGIGHTHHGYKGTYSFTVQLNGGEGGIVEIGDGYAINIVKGEDGSWTATPVGSNSISTGNVSFTFGNAVSENPDSGSWKISFDYELTGNAGHGEPGSATDNVLTDGSISLKVTDSMGKDAAESKITVEIHDDAPVLTVTETGGGEETSFSGKFTTTFGADHLNEIPFTIDGNEAKESGNGSWTFEVGGGKLIVTSEGRTDYSYQFVPDEGTTFTEKTFEITAIDGDKDTSTGVIKVINNTPTITPDPGPEPGPGPDPEPGPGPDDPENPVSIVGASGIKIAMDEAAFARRSVPWETGDVYQGPAYTAGIAGSGHVNHGYMGEASFTVQLKGGEGGKISIGDGYEITISKNEAGEWIATPNDKNVMEADNVRFTFDNAELKDADSGQWTIRFNYEMTNTVEHRDATKVNGDIWETGKPSLEITVTDDTGDIATGNIFVEIHDDGPVIKASQGETQTHKVELTTGLGETEVTQTLYEYVSNLAGDVVLSYGADGNAAENYMTINGDTVKYENGAYTYTDGQGTLTIKTVNGELKYEYKLNDGHEYDTIANKQFTVEIKDADGDTAKADITVFQNMKPQIPGTPPPGPDPDDPDSPVPAKPQMGTVNIEVDEAAWAKATSGEGTGHLHHGYAGESSFIAKLNGGEDGRITIGTGDSAIVIDLVKTADGYVATSAGGEFVTANGVKLTFGTNTAKVQPDGTVKVSFNYELTGSANHDQAAGNDEILSENNIQIKIEDNVNSVGEKLEGNSGGDAAYGWIHIEIHDDMPEVAVVEDTNNNAVTANFGADSWASEVKALEVFYKVAQANESGEAIIWNTGNGASTDISALGKDTTWSAIDPNGHTLTVTFDGEKYIFSTTDKKLTQDYRQELTVRITDADNDMDYADVVVTAPKILPPDPTDPGPDPEDPDDNTLFVADRIVRDEGDQTEKLFENDKLDSGHNHGMAGSFIVGMNGESGTIVLGENQITIEVKQLGEGDAIPEGYTQVALGFVAKITGNEITEATTGIKMTLAADPKDVLSYDADTNNWTVKYTAASTVAKTHDGKPGTVADRNLKGHIDIEVTDQSGESTRGAIVTELHDDIPVLVGAVVPNPSTPTNTDQTDNPNVDYVNLGGTFTVNFGADGKAEGNGAFELVQGESIVAATLVNGSYVFDLVEGTLTLTPPESDAKDEKFTYKFEPKDADKTFTGDDALSFTLNAVDKDGDKTTFELSVEQDFVPDIEKSTGTTPEINGLLVEVDDAALAASKGEEYGKGTQEHGIAGEKTFNVNLHGETGTITIGNDTTGKIEFLLDESGHWTPSGPSTITVDGVKLTDFSVKANGDTWDVSYKYELTDQFAHGKGEDIHNVKVDLAVVDETGDKATANIDINIYDDIPDANDIHVVMDHNSWVYGNVLDNDIFGSDGQAAKEYIVWDEPVANGSDILEVVKTGDNAWEVTTTYGTVQLNPDGTYAIHTTDTSQVGNKLSGFKYTITDGDTDTSRAELTLEVPKRPSDGTPDHNDKDPDPTPIVGGEDNSIIIANTDISIQEGETPPNYNLTFVLDMSYSMKQYSMNGTKLYDIEGNRIAGTEGIKSRYEELLGSLKTSLLEMQDYVGDVNISVISFNGGSEIVANWQNNTFKALTGTDIDEMLAKLTAQSNTNYDSAFRQTAHLLEQQHKQFNISNGFADKVVFVTDGDPTSYIPEKMFQLDTHSSYSALKGVEIPIKNLIEHPDQPVILKGTDGKSYTVKYESGNYTVHHPNSSIKPITILYGQDASNTDGLDQTKAEEAFKLIQSELNGTFEVIGISSNNSISHKEWLQNNFDSDKKVDFVDSDGGLKFALDEIMSDITANMPESDFIYGNVGNDVMFGDGINLEEIIKNHPDGKGLSQSEYGQFILDHPELFDKSQDPIKSATGNTIIIDKPDVMLGGTGDDIVYGQGGNDVLFGDGDNTAPTSGHVPDALKAAATLAGNSGADTPAELIAQLGTMSREELQEYSQKLEGENGIEKPTDGNDMLFGGTGNDVLMGGGGDDVLVGGEGSDYLFGGSGNDILIADKSDAFVDGGSGNDVVIAGQVTLEGIKSAYGADANTSTGDLVAAIQNNPGPLAALLAASGADFSNIAGGAGNDVLIGENGSDVLMADNFVKDALNQLFGHSDTGSIKNIISGYAKGEITAGKLAEVAGRLDGSDGKGESFEQQHESASDGNDKVFGLGGTDMVYGGAGDDLIDGGSGDDILFGGSGNDTVLGGSGNDLLFGGSGDDFLDGGSGSDTIFGGLGNDIIIYDSADKIIDGGEGFDILLVGNKDNVSLRDMLKEDYQGNVKSIEVVLTNNKVEDPAESGLASVAALAAIGITIADDRVSIDENLWKREEAGENDTTTVYKYQSSESGLDLTVEVSNKALGKPDTAADEAEADQIAAINIMGEDGSLLPADSLLDAAGEDAIHGEFMSADESMDILFGARDNDILVVSKSDIFIDGGMNVDVVVTSDTDLSLKDMLEQGQKDQIDPDAAMPAMRDVDVLIKGDGLDTISSADELAEKYGVKLNEDGKGIELGNGWTPVVPDSVASGGNDDIQVATYEYATDDGKLTLETTLVRPPLQGAQDAGQAVEEPEETLVADSDDTSITPDADNEGADQDDPAAADGSLTQPDDETGLAAADEAGNDEPGDQPEFAEDAVSAELAGADQTDAADQLDEISEELVSADQPEAAADATGQPEVADAVADEPETTLADVAQEESGPITLVTKEEHDRLASEQEKEAQAETQVAAAEVEIAETVDIPDVPFIDAPDLATEATTTMQIHSDSGSAV